MAPPPNPATPDDTPAQADAAFYRDALHTLITVGTSLARNLGNRAAPQPAPAHPAPPSEPPPAPEAAIAAFDRLARAVRRCIALARTLHEPPKPAPADPARHRTAARKRILREVEDTIARAHEGDRADALAAELHDRLDAPDLEDDLAHRPVADIIADIRRDLGLAAHPGTAPWKRRTPGDLADLHARAAAPSHAPGPGPRAPLPGGVPAPAPRPPSATPAPPRPAAGPVLQPVPAQGGDGPAGNPAGLGAAILRHPAHPRDRWRPPPGG